MQCVPVECAVPVNAIASRAAADILLTRGVKAARGMLGSTTGRSMLILALMQVVVQCIIEYEYR